MTIANTQANKARNKQRAEKARMQAAAKANCLFIDHGGARFLRRRNMAAFRVVRAAARNLAARASQPEFIQNLLRIKYRLGA